MHTYIHAYITCSLLQWEPFTDEEVDEVVGKGEAGAYFRYVTDERYERGELEIEPVCMCYMCICISVMLQMRDMSGARWK
jgi:hypothetical protein